MQETRKLLAGLFLSILVFPLFSQYQTVNLSAGVGDLRGDLKAEGITLDDLIFEYAISGTHILLNERWRFLFEASFYSGTQVRELGMDSTGASFLTSEFGGTTLMLGSRYVLTDNVNEYNSYPGQIIPFAGLLGGVTFANSKVTRSDAEVDFFEEVSSTAVAPVFEAQLGANIVIYKRLRALIFGGFRYALSDFLEGIEGSTNVNDLYFRLGFGLTYNITSNPNETRK